MRKWLPALPILIGAAVSATLYERLPAEVLPDWSRIVPVVAGGEPPATTGSSQWPTSHSFGSMNPRFLTTSNLPALDCAMYMFMRR